METIRTLIVDDEARIRRGIERLVQSCGEGWEVVAAVGDGLQALEYLKESDGRVDLLITDVKMPEMDGLTLIREARKTYSFYPLVISGYDDFTYVRDALREGALDYLLKPVDRTQFRERMADIGSKISGGRYKLLKWGEMEREAERLKESRQIGTLGAITSTDIDLASLGYWVDDFPAGRYLLSNVRLDTPPVKARTFTAKDWKAYYYALENIIREVVSSGAGEGRKAWCWRGSDSDFWTLLHTSDTDDNLEEAMSGLAEEIRSAVRTYTPFSVSAAFGEPIEDLYMLPEAKRRTLHLMDYRLVYGENRVFRSAAIHPDGRGLESEWLPLALQLKRSVEQANAEAAAEWADRLFVRLERLESPDWVQAAVQNAAILIHSVRLESHKSLPQAMSLSQDLAQLRKAPSLQELKRRLNRMIGQVIREIAQSREAGGAKPVEKAAEWILEHLGEDLTVKKIADRVHMNPTYFCECFKLQTGETVLDFLTRHRMSKAKELLAGSPLKLQDVSRSVGYQDVKYFSRLFKQWTGQTPTQYRESI
ncbi:response regulator transcription factor [Cohnella candidum]|uniref:Response regulator n=1 Tax=Cohnella candidum TaxID=2674991 RepID=A0A3G3JVC0_9BACL|nr:helix-turn-helix domain-containing protein [Cohnella candidum]AYQ72166.1 response regulator [Cohnella candidum]